MDTVALNSIPYVACACPNIQVMLAKTHAFDTNMQMRLLSEHDLKPKIKSQEWAKLTANKKALMTIICGQCNNTSANFHVS